MVTNILQLSDKIFRLLLLSIVAIVIASDAIVWNAKRTKEIDTSPTVSLATLIPHPVRLPLTPIERPQCGAISLYLICDAAGCKQSLSNLRKLTATSDESGVDMYNLQSAAKALGFNAEAKKLTFPELRNYLDNANCFAVLHFIKGHFAAAMGTRGSKVLMLDPLRGIEEADSLALASSAYGWDGSALLIKSPEPIPQ